MTTTLVGSTENIQPYPAANNPYQEQRQDPPSDVAEKSKEARLLFVIICFCTASWRQFLFFAVVSLQNALEMDLKISVGVLQIMWKENTSLHVNSPQKGVPLSHHNESLGWIGTSLANTVKRVCVNIHHLFVHSMCVAFSIISTDGLAASNYIPNKVAQCENSRFLQCISLCVQW